MLKNELLLQLQKSAQELGHSPQRREVQALAMQSYRLLGSFNRAKILAGLDAKNVRITKFPKNAFVYDTNLAAIVSYITFDGHLYKDLNGFYYSSKRINDLKAFEEIVTKKFELPPRYHLFNSGSRNQTHMIYFFNKKVCNFLLNSGTPKGEKVTQDFTVPEWIRKSKEFSREYLKIAYLCEGSFKDERGRVPRISFIQSKHQAILTTGINLMDTLKNMLLQFNIHTGKNYISKPRIRKKDGKLMQDIRFRIKVSDNNKFISEIGWLK